MHEIKHNKAYFDIAGIFAIIGVVIYHTFYGASSTFEDIPNNLKFASDLIRNLMTWAVPCLIMSCGSEMLDKNKKIGIYDIFGKYIAKIIISMLIFSIIFVLIDQWIYKEKVTFSIIKTGIMNVLTGEGWNHMWLMYVFIALYMIVPFYKKIADISTNMEIGYLLGVYFIFLSLLPAIEGIFGSETGFYICVYTIYPFYLFLGHAIDSRKIDIGKWLSLAIGILGIVLMAALTYYVYKSSNGKIEKLLTDYSFPVTILSSFGIYSFISYINIKSEKAKKVLSELGRCAFGVYILHMIIIKVIFVGYKLNPYQMANSIGILALICLLDLIATWIVVWLLRKIPFMRKII